MTEDLYITALVTAHMCHDLASPISAIGNGIKLVEITGIKLGQEGDLSKDSLASAIAQLKVFRVAYGQFKGSDMRSGSEVIALTEAWNAVARLQANLQEQDNAKRDRQVYFLLIQAKKIALLLGGIARLEMTDAASETQGKGRRVVIDPKLWRPLQSGAHIQNLAAKHVQFAILQAMTVNPVITTKTDLTVRF